MEILTVKMQESGYLVNGAMSVPSDPENRHYKLVQEWIAEGNTPEPEFTQAELDAEAEATERGWRDNELRRSDIEISKAEDTAGVFDAVTWRAYRISLRDWPAHAAFPDPGSRPIAPDAV